MYKQKEDVKNYIIQQLNDDVGLDQHICDLHHYLLNEDYFIIGSYRAEEWLKKDNSSVFEAIETIREYEESNFGKVSTDFSSSEKIANMLAYILGEEILYNNDTYNLFTKFSNEYLDEDKRDLLISSLKGE
jgi:flavorubredoxin